MTPSFVNQDGHARASSTHACNRTSPALSGAAVFLGEHTGPLVKSSPFPGTQVSEGVYHSGGKCEGAFSSVTYNDVKEIF